MGAVTQSGRDFGQSAEADAGSDGHPRPRRRRRPWRPSWITWVICVLALLGSGVGLYPSTAAWISSYQQSLIIKDGMRDFDSLDPSAAEQLAMARAYNDALVAGVALESGAPVPTGFGEGAVEAGFTYRDVLNANPEGLMSRVRIPGIGVDLPVYHGTDDATLLKGAGHLEGSHLPVGGVGTRSVITAHRGLASATMFNDLVDVQIGDRFTLNTLGEVLTYEVREIITIDPSDTAVVRPEQGRDLVTLITCTPLGINTHRIVVTGERVTPTPYGDIEAANSDPTLPFPWWAVMAGGVVLLTGAYLTRSGFVDARRRQAMLDRRAAATVAASGGASTGGADVPASGGSEDYQI